jgi:RNA polymerase sigma-70 factor (ECF subfamily)
MDQQAAYQRLIAPIETRMMRSIWRIVRHPDDAQDAMQEALATIWRRWARLESHPHPEALVLRICANAACDVLRRRRREGRLVDPAAASDDVPDAGPSALDTAAGAQAQARIRHAIAMLPRNQATAIVLHAIEDVSYEDVAAAMGCRAVTVRTHVARARARLRVLLADLLPGEREGKASHVGA